MKVLLYDAETHHLVCEQDIPDDVIDAAIKLERWLKEQTIGKNIVLYGLRLAD